MNGISIFEVHHLRVPWVLSCLPLVEICERCVSPGMYIWDMALRPFAFWVS